MHKKKTLQKYELADINCLENNIPYEKPMFPPSLHSNTLISITNALDAHAYLDDKGQLWISKEKIHQILRTTQKNASYIVDGFEDIQVFDKRIFVRGYEVIGQITKEIEEADNLRRGQYLTFSEQCLMAIRNSDRAVRRRAEYIEEWKKQKKKLKRDRIKLYSITKDELTGEELVKRTAEFSHIRSSSLFREYSLDIENGLVVNKQTHDYITQSNINDEEQLKFACEEKGWSTDWYNDYINRFPPLK